MLELFQPGTSKNAYAVDGFDPIGNKIEVRLTTMLLTEPEIKQILEQAQAAFPNFTDWEYNNEKNQEYFGFSVWGECVANPEELMPRRFFITLDTDHEDKWQGCLTIGQPSYLWSSADVGDAHLVSTEPYETLFEAITALKAKILELFQAFSIIN